VSTVHRIRRRRLNRHNGGNGNGNGGGMPRLVLVLLFLVGLGIVSLIVAAGAGFAFYQYYADDLVPPEQVIAQQPSSGAKIYDRNGHLLYQFVDDLAGLRNPITLDEVSPWLIKATISTEDANFYNHPGVNIRGLIRAAYENFFPGELGFLKGSGGSSITQQLARNLYISPEERQERSVPRKIKETVLALELERKYSKNQILEWYLNQISYGGLYNGVEAASQGYFGKHAKDLTLAEAALLAGIPASPANYDPVTNPEKALERRNQVLELMVKHGEITSEQAEQAVDEPIEIVPQRFPIEAPHWVLSYVQPILEELVGRDMLYRGGLRVTTTLDLDLQEKAQDALEQWISEFEETSNGHNGSVVAIDPKTGEILVMVGSRDYFRDDIQGRNNMAVAPNSPGSAFKPFTYLTAFMENGWGPGTMILDTPVSYTEPDGSVFSPRNPAGDYKGPISLRNALGNSLNVPAFKVAWMTGVDKIVALARKMGISTLTGSYGPSITIGGVDVTVLDMTYGYSVFANNGVMKGIPTLQDLPDGFQELDPIAILKIEDSAGNVIYEPDREEQQIVPPEYTYLVTDILSDPGAQCATFGCGGLSIPGYVAAVKTGTSEPFEGSHAIGDTWALGYTPDLVAGVWAGNADNEPMYNILSTSISWRALRDFMVAALADRETTSFVRPPGVVSATVCVPSGKRPSEYCQKTTTDLFVQGSLPTEEDDWWQPMKIDKRNGKLATELTPPKDVEEKVFLVLPPELSGFSREQAEEWAKSLDAELAPEEKSPLGLEPGAAGTPGARATPTSETTGPDAHQSTVTPSGPAHVAITLPRNGDEVVGELVVWGKAESPAFESYRLEFGEGESPGEWTLIHESTRSVEQGALGVFDSRRLDPDLYTIRLVVVDEDLGEVTTSITVSAGGQRNFYP
jgi:membrane peptidoglycan carboxypeptidase